jgi:hypothetical protein
MLFCRIQSTECGIEAFHGGFAVEVRQLPESLHGLIGHPSSAIERDDSNHETLVVGTASALLLLVLQDFFYGVRAARRGQFFNCTLVSRTVMVKAGML